MRLAAIRRAGPGEPIVYLHGLGCSKEDFAGAWSPDGLPGRGLLAFDLPGCGQTPYPAGADFRGGALVELVRAALDALGLGRVTVIGHSMGGLTGLELARSYPERVGRFINVEGNLAPEDCGLLSRRVVERHRAGATPAEVMAGAQLELATLSGTGITRYAEELDRRVDPRAMIDYCEWIVSASDHEPLIERFEGLGIPRAFVHGSENAGLSYIPRLVSAGIQVVAIPDSNHFPARSNPAAYYRVLGAILEGTAPLA